MMSEFTTFDWRHAPTPGLTEGKTRISSLRSLLKVYPA